MADGKIVENVTLGTVVDLKSKWRCQCGCVNEWSVWAAAHFHEPIIHICQTCGLETEFEGGEVIEISQGRFS